MKERSYAAPVTALLVVLLPILYIGSYFALVYPPLGNVSHSVVGGEEIRDGRVVREFSKHYYNGYRSGGDWARILFSPLEQIDRQLRPSAWGPMGVWGPNARTSR